MNETTLFEILARGAASGITILLCLHFAVLARTSHRARLGALFTFSTALWTIQSGPMTEQILGPLVPLAIFFSIFNSVFFWWFATALFDDSFRWKWWRFAPPVVIGVVQFVRWMWPETVFADAAFFVHQPLVIVLMAHAIYLSLKDVADDLVEERRQFRVAFASVAAITGIVISIFEMADWVRPVLGSLSWLQAVAILAPSLVFGFWLLSMRAALLVTPNAPSVDAAPVTSATPAISAADQPIFSRLMEIMEAGGYRQDGLTVAKLAEQVGVPEHVLRRIINQELGHRNFAAFLNSWRIRDAKTVLADPEKARRQILQIALDLGYGSIAPFNRAFKEATGLTPTEFRKQTLG